MYTGTNKRQWRCVGKGNHRNIYQHILIVITLVAQDGVIEYQNTFKNSKKQL